MLFSSISFLYFFLPAVLALYFVLPRRARNLVLLVSSLVFYAYGEPVYTLLLIFSSVADYTLARIIEKHRGRRGAKAALIASVCINLSMLFFFKYTDFFIANINAITGSSIGLLRLALPLGISFYTFQTMSYSIDVYRGDVEAAKNPFDFAAYVCMFPQLVAGPIVRYSTVAAELRERRTDIGGFARGAGRFTVGLAKKVLIANLLGELVDKLKYATSTSVLSLWIVAIAFSLQLYYDFSGYSDMAIGLGRMLGFSFPENFDHPFTSRSITEFWRRWHMTLGGWFRDYVYFPLGGSRVPAWRHIVNLLIVWALTGLWHGADWTFVVWGLYYAVLLILEKRVYGRFLEKRRVFGLFYTLLLTLAGFVIFSAGSLSDAISGLSGMLGGGGLVFSSADSLYYIKSFAPLIVIAGVGSTELPARLGRYIMTKKYSAVIEPVWYALLLIVSTAFLIDGTFNPFLYFRF